MAVQFSEEEQFNQSYRTNSSSGSVSGLTKWVIEKGIAKDEQGAKNIMAVVAVVCFTLAIYFAIK
jgi:Na+/alanine symporter